MFWMQLETIYWKKLQYAFTILISSRSWLRLSKVMVREYLEAEGSLLWAQL